MWNKATGKALSIITIAVAGISACYGAQKTGGHAFDKKRVAVSAHLTGTREILQAVTWQTHNPSSSSLHRRTAHLAVETTGRQQRTLWQVDGGNAYYKIDSVQAADLDGDGIPEIISLWREDPNAAALRVFRWDGAKQTFVEASSKDNLKGIRSYRITGSGSSKSGRRLVAHSISPAGVREYVLRGSELVTSGEAHMQETKQEESGIEGVPEVKVSHPVTRENEPEPPTRPYQTDLVILTMSGRREVARLKTGSDGRFRVSLPPGEYIIKPSSDPPKRFAPRAGEHLAKVSPGRFIFVRVTFESPLQ
ncbi:MAG TPA: hypothetical protein VLD57_03515 [Blastocatellia bacterium]|nr:hypothetical protein [Blastocatellia bacterium]